MKKKQFLETSIKTPDYRETFRKNIQVYTYREDVRINFVHAVLRTLYNIFYFNFFFFFRTASSFQVYHESRQAPFYATTIEN